MSGYKKCQACAHSYMEPDALRLACGHYDAGSFGVYYDVALETFCPDNKHFEQHPMRNEDGTLKKL